MQTSKTRLMAISGATLALVAIDVALLALGVIRFRRDKLITTQ